MNMQRKIIAIAGSGLLAILSIIVLSLVNVMSAFTGVTAETERSFEDLRLIESIVGDLSAASANMHHYLTGGDVKFRSAYETSHAALREKLSRLSSRDHDPGSRQLVQSLTTGLESLENKIGRIFLMNDPFGRNRAPSFSLMVEVDDIIARINRDIETYIHGEYSARLGSFAGYFRFLRSRVFLLFIMVLFVSACMLLAFAYYIRRTVTLPLAQLRNSADEISRGNLDHQVLIPGSGDITDLAEQFNAMARKLKQSHADLEQKLVERTHELAAIDSVALALGRAGTLRDVLSRTLVKIMDSLPHLEPRGGIFLVEPDGETLRLAVHIGLSPEFARQEETISMGECLCGMVAQTGEMLFMTTGCDDPRHTRGAGMPPHAHIIIPLKSRGIVLGVVFLYPSDKFVMRPTDAQMLDAMGAQLGLAVENFRFYDEVKQSSEKYWDLFENARDILFTTDTGGALTAVNKAAEQFIGLSKIELIGRNIADFLTPDGLKAIRGMIRKKTTGPGTVIEFEIVKPNGDRAFVEVNTRKIFAHGAVTGYQASARDMTEQRTMRELDLKAERLGAIGQVGIAVRHEINNPLTTIIGNVELLIERYEKRDRELTARLEVILNNSLRIAEITKRLQEIKKEKIVDYLHGVKMTDLKHGGGEPEP